MPAELVNASALSSTQASLAAERSVRRRQSSCLRAFFSAAKREASKPLGADRVHDRSASGPRWRAGNRLVMQLHRKAASPPSSLARRPWSPRVPSNWTTAPTFETEPNGTSDSRSIKRGNCILKGENRHFERQSRAVAHSLRTAFPQPIHRRTRRRANPPVLTRGVFALYLLIPVAPLPHRLGTRGKYALSLTPTQQPAR